MLRIEHLTKEFDGARVLDDVALSIGAGEVHGLAGHNGSGKSTLIKCLSGFHSPTGSWSLDVAGQHVTRALQPGAPARLGITFVHQVLGLLPDLTVLENLMLFRLGTDRSPYVSWPAESRRATALFATFGIPVDPRAPLSTLRPVEQAQVAIVRAVDQLQELRAEQPGARGVLVLDEATTFLDRSSRSVLHGLIRTIAADGYGVLFVSHDVDELLTVTDRITVLREGRVIGSLRSADVVHDDVVALILGDRSAVDHDERRDHPAPGTRTGGGAAAAPSDAGTARSAPALSVAGLRGEFLRRVDLQVQAGEILGVTGIIGGGWELVPDFVYGARRAAGGTIDLGGGPAPAERATPERSLRAGVVYVPPDRQAHAVVGQLSVQENVMLPVLSRMFRRGHLQLSRMTRACRRLLGAYSVLPPAPRAPIATLSGGNQQKAVLAKWLQLAPRIVLLNEPTQGVDVGARRMIMDEIRELADGGAVVVYASGDWDEVARIADRVVVVADGIVAAELEGDALAADGIARAAFRGTEQADGMQAAEDIWERVQ